MKKFLTLLTMVYFFSILISYTNIANADEWTKNLSISRIAVEGDYIIIDTNSTSGTCGKPGRFIAKNDSKRNNLYAMAMTAFLFGKKTDIYFDSDGCINQGNVILVMNIY